MQQSSSRGATGLQVYHRARNILQLVLLSCTDKSCSLSPKYLFHINYFNIIIPCIRKSSNFLSVSPLRVPPPQPERTSPLPIPLPVRTNNRHWSKNNFYIIGIVNEDAVCSP